MANVKTISFGPGNGDLEAQQIELQRRQMMADALRKQAIAPLQQQEVSGRVVKISPWEGLAKLGQQFMVNRQQKGLDEEQNALGVAKKDRMIAALERLRPGGPRAPAVPGAEPVPGDGGSDQFDRALAAMQVNPELGNDLMKNLLTETNEQKNFRAMGVDPKKMGAAQYAEALKKGRTEAAPGTTIYDSNMNPLVAVPDFKSGVSGSFGPDGQPRMAPIPGSEVIAQQAGAVKAAEAGANAGYDMVTVATPEGPKMMTRAQAASLANGGAPTPAPAAAVQGAPQVPAKGFPAGTQLPKPTPGQQSRREILQQEFDAIQQRPDTDPRKAADLAAIQREMGGAGAGAGTPGIKLQTEAAKEAEVGAVKVKNSVDEALAKQLPQERKDRQNAIVKGEAAISLIDKALTHPGLKTATGLSSVIDPRNYIPGTNAKNFGAIMEQLGGKTFLEAMESLRGTGQITEIEGKKASAAIARLSTAQSEGEFTTALKDFRSAVSDGIARSKAGKDGIDVARDKLNEPVRKYNPVTQRIE